MKEIDVIEHIINVVRLCGENAYIHYRKKMDTTDCLNGDAKLEDHSFGTPELYAHRKASEFYGAYLAFHEVLQLLHVMRNELLDEPNEADALNARLNEIALEMDSLDNPERWRKLNEEYMETYTKLIQLRSEQ